MLEAIGKLVCTPPQWFELSAVLKARAEEIKCANVFKIDGIALSA
jgi:hypothetical protein